MKPIYLVYYEVDGVPEFRFINQVCWLVGSLGGRLLYYSSNEEMQFRGNKSGAEWK